MMLCSPSLHPGKRTVRLVTGAAYVRAAKFYRGRTHE
jgi:ferric-dicitrate binding protein FerR (iron transport regulator)